MSAQMIFYKAIRKYHAVIGILVAFHLIILSLSGLMLLFKAEIQHAPPQIKTSVDQNECADKYNHAHQLLLHVYPNDRPLDIYPDENNPQIIQARLGIDGVNKVRGARIVNLDYQSGQEIQATELRYSELYNWLLTLHHQLFLGQNGQIYIAIIGIAFILMNVTGLLMFLKRRRNQSSSPPTRLLAKCLYVHQRLGAICLCWGLVVGVTGTLLAFNPIFTRHFQQATLQQLAEKYQSQQEKNRSDIALKSVINTAFKSKPDGVIWYIVFPGMERGIQGHYLVLMHGSGMLSKYISEYLVISAKSAELKEVVHLPVLMQLALIATPFHTANYGGILLKIIWAIFAVSTLSFVLLGITISYSRKKIIYARTQ